MNCYVRGIVSSARFFNVGAVFITFARVNQSIWAFFFPHLLLLLVLVFIYSEIPRSKTFAGCVFFFFCCFRCLGLHKNFFLIFNLILADWIVAVKRAPLMLVAFFAFSVAFFFLAAFFSCRRFNRFQFWRTSFFFLREERADAVFCAAHPILRCLLMRTWRW